MSKSCMLAAGLLTILAGTVDIVSTSSAKQGETGGIMQPPPDYEAVIRSEFATFEQRGTVEAYELFIARHPDHPLAEKARARIAQLRRTQLQEKK